MQVTYNAYGFLEKNRDTLSQNLFDVMKKSDSAFVSDLFTSVLRDTGSFTTTRYYVCVSTCLLFVTNHLHCIHAGSRVRLRVIRHLYSTLLWDEPIARDAKIWPMIARGSHSFTCHPLTNSTCFYSPAAEHHPLLAGTHCTYPQRDGQAELTWVAGYILR